MGFWVLYWVMRASGAQLKYMIVCLSLVVVSILFTDVRAGLMSIVVGAGAACLYFRASAGWRFLCYLVVVIMLAVLVVNYNQIIESMGDTWKYRADLVVYSADAFSKSPLFGAHDYRSNEVLVANMTQGQGIVDMVNVYLMITLRYGLVGLGLLLCIIWLAMAGLRRELAKRVVHKDGAFFVGLTLFSAIGALLFFIYSASFIGALEYGFWYLVALVSAYVKWLNSPDSGQGADVTQVVKP
jgi:O-antigen ligase